MAADVSAPWVSISKRKWSVQLSWRHLDAAPVDLDLSCIGTDDAGEYIDHACGMTLKGKMEGSKVGAEEKSVAVEHSGDTMKGFVAGTERFTGMEEVTVESVRVPPAVKYLFFIVSSPTAATAFDAAATQKRDNPGAPVTGALRVTEGTDGEKTILWTYSFDISILRAGLFCFAAKRVEGKFRVFEMMRESACIHSRRDFTYGLRELAAFTGAFLETPRPANAGVQRVATADDATVVQGVPWEGMRDFTESTAQDTSLYVNVQQARRLMAADDNGLSDPYVKVLYRENDWEITVKGEKKTSVIKGNLDPVWQDDENHILAFTPGPGLIDEIDIEVWDKDLVGSDFLGMYVGYMTSSTYFKGPNILPLSVGNKKDTKVKVKGTITGFVVVSFRWGPPGLKGAALAELMASK